MSKQDDSLPLGDWIAVQERRCAGYLTRSLSRTDLVHERPEFGQQVSPLPGTVLASPVSAHWDPEPDYFYHWTRDAAIVMEEVSHLGFTGTEADAFDFRSAFDDYVAFSLGTTRIDGNAFVPNPIRPSTREDCLKFVRPDEELARLDAFNLPGEPRFNPDGTPDLQRWARPQYDGPALRALTLARHAGLLLERGEPIATDLLAILQGDLEFTIRHAGKPCIGPWEEDNEHTLHSFTLICQIGALEHGRKLLDLLGDAFAMAGLQEAIDEAQAALTSLWNDELSIQMAHGAMDPATPAEAVDTNILMAALHADLPDGDWSLSDARVERIVEVLTEMFSNLYPINATLPDGEGPLIGRSLHDRYFGGNPWFATSLALAEYHYRRASGAERTERLSQGDAIVAACRRFIPEDGAMSEQIDRATGEPLSARHLTWSYAAFLAAASARREALASD
ncbi:Glucoamylase amyD [Hartmannibacter diazotrophicus]|uniref:glucan 1,4-alpha-glucosidase n=1 Tax=Hartmannibacter diazotrophicus TaxID=1482074 RepID=A0A2C9D6L4_9HYPH|nr:glycoside hydrolase family 15 protein [Hartmannibacter diazotrophicus]SON55936.1 Glucoamylase amyD [Hartmannibacter diazotrophicus]